MVEKAFLTYKEMRKIEDIITPLLVQNDDGLWSYSNHMDENAITAMIRADVPRANVSHIRRVRAEQFGPLRRPAPKGTRRGGGGGDSNRSRRVQNLEKKVAGIADDVRFIQESEIAFLKKTLKNHDGAIVELRRDFANLLERLGEESA